MKKSLKPSYAYIIPISRTIAERILVKGKTVLVKFLTSQSIAQRFSKGTKIIFYETGGNKLLLGEAIVNTAELLLSSQVVSLYRESLFISPEELDDYVNRYPNRGNKKILTLTIKNARAFNNPIQSNLSISMVGRFLDEKMYNTEIRNSSK